MSEVLANIIIILIGLGLVVLYVWVANNKFGARINFLEAIIYKVDVSGFSSRFKIIEIILRWLKYWGVLMVIVGFIAIFSAA